MKPSYFIIFFIGIVCGWGIYQFETKSSSLRYDQPSVCEVLGKNHPECK
jgi:hypothetical protein